MRSIIKPVFLQILVCLAFMSVAGIALAQPALRPKLSDKHINRVNKAKNGHQKLNRYHKYYSKDSAHWARAVEKHWKGQLDSLEKSMDRERTALLKMAKKEAKGKLPQGTLDNYQNFQKMGLSAGEILHTPKEKLKGEYLPQAMEIGAERLRLQEEYSQMALLRQQMGQYNEVAGQYMGLLENPDSLKATLKEGAGAVAQGLANRAESELADRAEFEQLLAKQKELDALKSLPQQYKAQGESYMGKVGSLSDKEAMKAEARKLAQEQAERFLEQNRAQLDRLQGQVSRLAGKYSYLPNSNDLSTAVKQTSLKGKPLRQRFFLGGDFKILGVKPLSVDFVPQIGFKLDKRAVIGASFAYRQSFGDTLAFVRYISHNMYGYRVFGNYMVARGFYGHLEWGRSQTDVLSPDGMGSTLSWTNTLQVGVGREFAFLPKVNATVLLLYDFEHEQGNGLGAGAWTVRTGFRANELAFLKRKR